MIEKLLRKDDDKYNLKSVHLKDYTVDKGNIEELKRFNISADYNIFLQKFAEFPDPFLHLPSIHYVREQYCRNLLLSPPRYEIIHRFINGNIKISMIKITLDGEEHYKVVRNFFPEMRIDQKYTGDFIDTFIVFMEKNI